MSEVSEPTRPALVQSIGFPDLVRDKLFLIVVELVYVEVAIVENVFRKLAE